MKTPLVLSTVAILLSGALFAHANDNDYYSNDLDDAVKNAQSSASSSQYVGERWYNRTTSKSFNFPKLMNTEMSTKAIHDALDSTAMRPGAHPPERMSPLRMDEQQATASNKDSSEIDRLPESKATLVMSDKPDEVTKELVYNVFYVEKIEYENKIFKGVARELRSESKIRAYQTPEQR